MTVAAVQIPFWYGIGEKNRILAAMRASHPLYLTVLRSFAREVCYRNGSVTIDDVRETVAEREFPMPEDIGADTRVFGVVFASKDFVAIGQEPTRRAERISRSGRGASFVTRYRLAGAA